MHSWGKGFVFDNGREGGGRSWKLDKAVWNWYGGNQDTAEGHRGIITFILTERSFIWTANACPSPRRGRHTEEYRAEADVRLKAIPEEQNQTEVCGGWVDCCLSYRFVWGNCQKQVAFWSPVPWCRLSEVCVKLYILCVSLLAPEVREQNSCSTDLTNKWISN